MPASRGRARASTSVDLRGIHAHIGSQVFVADFIFGGMENATEIFYSDQSFRRGTMTR